MTTVMGSLLENLSTLGRLLADLTNTVSDISASLALSHTQQTQEAKSNLNLNLRDGAQISNPRTTMAYFLSART